MSKNLKTKLFALLNKAASKTGLCRTRKKTASAETVKSKKDSYGFTVGDSQIQGSFVGKGQTAAHRHAVGDTADGDA